MVSNGMVVGDVTVIKGQQMFLVWVSPSLPGARTGSSSPRSTPGQAVLGGANAVMNNKP